MIFLLVMSPILHLVANWAYQGFRPLLPLPGTESLPPKDSTEYVLWDEPDSSEPKGWYLVTICDYLLDGKAVLRYPGGETEELHLHSVQWILARKNGKHFRECMESLPKPPKSALNRIKHAQGKEHKAKAFADDLTIINSSPSDHQSSLLVIDSACQDRGLTLSPSKCISLSVDHVVPKSSFHLKEGVTKGIAEAPTKFLGQTLAANQHTT